MNKERQRKASGSLFGLAFGDALGADTEFMSVEQISAKYGPEGPGELQGKPARVTDDTQMTLAVGEALLAAEKPYSADTLEEPLRAAFIAWDRSPDNNRAPGNTCLQACEGLARNLPWQNATVVSSKGCGANMRVAPVGLLRAEQDEVTPETRAAIAQFQAALTHGHPTALAASDLTAWCIADLVSGGEPEGLVERLRDYALSQRSVYHQLWLGPLWQISLSNTPQEFIERGWDECLQVLERLDAALKQPDRQSDPCLQTGAGWIAEEAFATGLLCFLLYPEEPIKAIQRAATTSGDSDSIACLAGAFAGAHLGLDAWPQPWLDRIEYRDRLAKLGTTWD
jgi:ADP-ribosylglycohydrolase